MLNRPTAKNQHRCRPCLKKKQRRCSKFRRMSNDDERWQIPNHLTMGWHQFWWSIVTFHTIFSQFLFYTSHKFNPNSSYLVRKQAGCGKEWWTMWKIPIQFKTGWDPFWRSILIFSWTYTFSRISHYHSTEAIFSIMKTVEMANVKTFWHLQM